MRVCFTDGTNAMTDVHGTEQKCRQWGSTGLHIRDVATRTSTLLQLVQRQPLGCLNRQLSGIPTALHIGKHGTIEVGSKLPRNRTRPFLVVIRYNRRQFEALKPHSINGRLHARALRCVAAGAFESCRFPSDTPHRFSVFPARISEVDPGAALAGLRIHRTIDVTLT